MVVNFLISLFWFYFILWLYLLIIIFYTNGRLFVPLMQFFLKVLLILYTLCWILNLYKKTFDFSIVNK